MGRSGSTNNGSKHAQAGGATGAENAEDEQAEPPASVLTRRRALVPPKIPPYNMDSSEEADHSSVDKETSTRSVSLFLPIFSILILLLLLLLFLLFFELTWIPSKLTFDHYLDLKLYALFRLPIDEFYETLIGHQF